MRNEVLRQKMFSLIDQWQQSGLTIKLFCEQNHVTNATFHYWYKNYRTKRTNLSSFKRLEVSSHNELTCAELIYPDGKRLVFHQPVSSEYLKALIA